MAEVTKAQIKALDWHPCVHSDSADRWRNGTELDYCIPPGYMSRFAIYAVRTHVFQADPDHVDAMGFRTGGYRAPDVVYRVRDAATVSDADVSEGKRPAVVGAYPTLEKALAALPEIASL